VPTCFSLASNTHDLLIVKCAIPPTIVPVTLASKYHHPSSFARKMETEKSVNEAISEAAWAFTNVLIAS
jgi:hypothetical protein